MKGGKSSNPLSKELFSYRNSPKRNQYKQNKGSKLKFGAKALLSPLSMLYNGSM